MNAEMTDNNYRIALKEIARLEQIFHPNMTLTSPHQGLVTLLGFAIDSETLQPLAIIEAGDMHLHAYPPPCINMYLHTCPGQDHGAPDTPIPSVRNHLDARNLSVLRHRKGGLYTRIGTVIREAMDFILYVSHDDRTWWLRPKDMFEDGRFSAAEDIPPLDLGVRT